jgi:hypothetical protein
MRRPEFERGQVVQLDSISLDGRRVMKASGSPEALPLWFTAAALLLTYSGEKNWANCWSQEGFFSRNFVECAEGLTLAAYCRASFGDAPVCRRAASLGRGASVSQIACSIACGE